MTLVLIAVAAPGLPQMRKLRIWVRRPKRAPFLDLLGASVS